MKQKTIIESSAFKISLFYLIIGILWILLSDRLVHQISMHNIQLQRALETYKGIFYVITTFVLLYYLIKRRERKREQLESEILTSNEKWQNVFESANDPIFILDTRYNIIDVNTRAMEIYGYTEEEFKKLNIRDIRAQHQSDIIHIQMNEAISHSGARYEMEHIRKDGTNFPVEISTRAVTREGRLEFIHIVHDLSDRKRIERKLIESEKKYRTLVETSHDLIWIVDKNLCFTFVNEASREVYGLEPSRLIGKSMLDFLVPGSAGKIKELIMKTAESGENVLNFQCDIVDSKGREKYLLSNGVLFKDKNGALGSLCGTSLDITERVEAENRIKYLNRIHTLLTSINQLIVRASDKEAILEDACRLSVQYGGFKMAWVGVPDPETGKIKVGFKYGDNDNYLETLDISINEPEEIRGPIINAILNNIYYVSNDIKNDGMLVKWREKSLEKGYRSFATFPIEVKNKAVAVFNIYSDKENFFGKHETELMLELVEDISFSLEYLELENEKISIQKRYEDIVESTPVAIFVQLNGIITYINPAAVRILGAESDKEFIGKKVYDIVHPDYHQILEERMSDLYMGKQVNEIEEKFKKADGSSIDVLVSAIPYSQGNLTGAQVFFRDLSRQKKAENQLREINDRLNLITKATNDAIWDWNLITDQVWWSDGFSELFGYKAGETENVTDSWISRIHPSDVNFVVEGIKEVIKDGKEFWFDEYRFRKRDNTYAYVFDRGYVIRDSSGVPVRMTGSMIDISYRKKMEEDLRASEEKYRSIFENSPSIISVIDRQYKVVSINRLNGELGGVNVLGKSILAHSLPEDVPMIKDAFEQCFKTGRPASYTSRVCNSGGGIAYHDVMVAPQIKSGKVEFLTLIATDITGKVKSEEQLVESRARLKGIVESAMDAIISINSDKKIILFNKAAEKMFTRSYDEVINKELNILVPERFHRNHYNKIDMFGKSGITSRSIRNIGTLTGLRSNGDEFPIEASISFIDVKGERYYTAILRDVTERIAYEKTIEESNEKLHALAGHLQTIREEERTLIAREIHDQLGQELTALKMDISFLSKKIEKTKNKPDWEAYQAGLKSMTEITDHTINSVRRIASELRPDILDKLGLKEAIEWHAEEFKKRTGIECDVKIDSAELNFNSVLNITIYRIIQESLTNVARHSGATKSEIVITHNGNLIYLNISDNGRGIKSEEIENSKSLGLVGIKERAYNVNGEFKIYGDPARGTTISITIPVN